MTKAGVWRRPTPKPPASENPRRQPLRQRRAQVARFGEAVGGNRLGGQNRLGGLRGGVHDHRVGDAPQPPAGGDAVELALGVLAVRAGADDRRIGAPLDPRSEEHTSELQSLMRISYAVFCLKKKKQRKN